MVSRIVCQVGGAGLREWLFKLFFRQEWELMVHQMNDIIWLERKVKTLEASQAISFVAGNIDKPIRFNLDY